MRILFMGTPDFALFSLRALVEAGEDVIGVVTQPDKPKGRGYALTPPPVKVYAEEKGLPVYQPATLRGDEFAATLAALDPDLSPSSRLRQCPDRYTIRAGRNLPDT